MSARVTPSQRTRPWREMAVKIGGYIGIGARRVVGNRYTGSAIPPSPPPAHGSSFLLEDGTSYWLLEDGTSIWLLEG